DAPTDPWSPLVQGQLRLFFTVWGTYVKRQFGALRDAGGGVAQYKDIAVEEPRAAAIYAAAWLLHPNRVVRDVEPELKRLHNLDVACAVLGEVARRLREANDEIYELP